MRQNHRAPGQTDAQDDGSSLKDEKIKSETKMSPNVTEEKYKTLKLNQHQVAKLNIGIQSRSW